MKYKIENLPVHLPHEELSQKFSHLVEGISAKKAVEIDTTAEEQQIDLMVYKLNELTYDEVLIVDPETPISKEKYAGFTL